MRVLNKQVLAFLLSILILTLVSCKNAPSHTKASGDFLALCNCTVIDGTSAPPAEQRLLLLKDGRIESISGIKEKSIPENYTKIDMHGSYVLPGFINTHVHSSYSEENLQNWLLHGVTTVRDLAARVGTDFVKVRDKLNKNQNNARIVLASPIFTKPGGYIPPFNLDVNSPEDAGKKVSEILKSGPDVIKIPIEDNLQGRSWNMLSLEEIKSITAAAHDGNKKVAAHISHAYNLRLALDGGVDELSHMVVEPLDDKIVQEIVQKNIYWVPTLELWQGVSKAYLLDWDKVAMHNLSMFYRAGGKIALGTDFGGYICKFDNGMPLTEISLMKSAGMSNMDIIVSATKNAAHVCGMDDMIGTLEKGKYADLIVVNENPLQNIEVLGNLQMVIHNGKIITDKRNSGM